MDNALVGGENATALYGPPLMMAVKAANLVDCLHLLVAADRAAIAEGKPGSTGATALVNWRVSIDATSTTLENTFHL
eukprot:SAG31_NODE_4_length_45662_cov_15.654622_21_plen_77_part_00